MPPATARRIPVSLAPNGQRGRSQHEDFLMDTATLVPIALFVSIAWSIKAVVDSRVRKQLVSSNGSPDLVRSILEGDEANRRLSSLRWGITLVALALGFGIVEAAGWRDVTPGAIAVLVGALGLGNLAFFAASRKLR
ncbi:MAG: hypothetical protein QM612_10650 [Thermomonas sp.]|uniref:hypothetical protein n=1 Tax=Thermomonas sp. TaxID=1971895 RepID=UPI0039E648CD